MPYPAFTAMISDAQFRVGVAVTAIVLVVGITAVRFCGSVSLPAKPPPPPPRNASTSLLIDEVNASPAVYKDFLAKDAAVAGVRTPTYEEMSRKFVFRSDGGRQVLEPDRPGVDMAGLKLELVHDGDALLLAIRNTTRSSLGYAIWTEPSPAVSDCNSVPAVPYNAMTIEPDHRIMRVECAYRPGLSIVVKRVETVELSGLAEWYLSQVPPQLLGIEERVGRGHQNLAGNQRCISMVSQAVRSGLESGEIGWRDLADFYARHRCQTYAFPSSYRAFTADGQRPLPST